MKLKQITEHFSKNVFQTFIVGILIGGVTMAIFGARVAPLFTRAGMSAEFGGINYNECISFYQDTANCWRNMSGSNWGDTFSGGGGSSDSNNGNSNNSSTTWCQNTASGATYYSPSGQNFVPYGNCDSASSPSPTPFPINDYPSTGSGNVRTPNGNPPVRTNPNQNNCYASNTCETDLEP